MPWSSIDMIVRSTISALRSQESEKPRIRLIRNTLEILDPPRVHLQRFWKTDSLLVSHVTRIMNFRRSCRSSLDHWRPLCILRHPVGVNEVHETLDKGSNGHLIALSDKATPLRWICRRENSARSCSEPSTGERRVERDTIMGEERVKI